MKADQDHGGSNCARSAGKLQRAHTEGASSVSVQLPLNSPLRPLRVRGKVHPSTLWPRTQTLAAMLLLFRRSQLLKKTETPKETTKGPRPEPDLLPEEHSESATRGLWLSGQQHTQVLLVRLREGRCNIATFPSTPGHQYVTSLTPTSIKPSGAFASSSSPQSNTATRSSYSFLVLSSRQTNERITRNHRGRRKRRGHA